MNKILFVCGSTRYRNRTLRLAYAQKYLLKKQAKLILSVETHFSPKRLRVCYLSKIEHTPIYQICRHKNTYEEVCTVRDMLQNYTVSICSNFWHIPRIWLLCVAHISKQQRKNLHFSPVWHTPGTRKHVCSVIKNEIKSYKELYKFLKIHHERKELKPSWLKTFFDIFY